MYLWTSARLLFLDHSTEVLIRPFALVLLQCAKDLFHGIKTVTLRGNFNFGNKGEHLRKAQKNDKLAPGGNFDCTNNLKTIESWWGHGLIIRHYPAYKSQSEKEIFVWFVHILHS